MRQIQRIPKKLEKALRRWIEKLRQFQWTESRRIIATGILCAALLLACALIPLAFRQTEPSPEPEETRETDFTAADRSALFLAYWNNDAPAVTHERLDSPGSRMTNFCRQLMGELVSRCIDDVALESREPTGSEYTIVTGRNGTLRLCRMWLQAKGDWQNWLDVCFNADSGEIYYLYLSRECLTNRELYPDVTDRPDGQAIADMLAAVGGDVRFFGDENGDGLAVLSVADGAICYEIRSVNYDALIDVKVSCA